MRGKTGYLFQRPGSRNWHIKLQSPTERIESVAAHPTACKLKFWRCQ